MEILLDAKFTVSQTKDKVIQRLQQHIKLYYDIENPALIELAEEDQETVDNVQDGVLEEVREEDPVEQDLVVISLIDFE